MKRRKGVAVRSSIASEEPIKHPASCRFSLAFGVPLLGGFTTLGLQFAWFVRGDQAVIWGV